MANKKLCCIFCVSTDNVRYIYDVGSKEKYPCCRECERKIIEAENKRLEEKLESNRSL